MRWRGNFSELDTVHWSEKLKAELNYDPKTAAMVDNGMNLGNIYGCNKNTDI